MDPNVDLILDTFDGKEDPIPTAMKVIDSNEATLEEMVFLAKSLLFAHAKIEKMYITIEKSPLGPQKLCDVANAANAYVRVHGAGDSPEGLALVEAVDAVWRNDNA